MGNDTESERPEPVDGTVFPASAGKALGGVFGGIILTALSLLVVVWRFGGFVFADRRPTLFIAIAAIFVALLGPCLVIVSLLRLVRKRRLVVGADRLQLVETRGGAEVVVAQVMYANVKGLVPVKTEAGRQLNVKLENRDADGTHDTANAIRRTPDKKGYDLVIEDHYQGKMENLTDAVDEAVRAWRAAQEPA